MAISLLPLWDFEACSRVNFTFTLPSALKRQGRGVDHPPPSSVEVKERVELHLYFPFCAFLDYSRVPLLIFTFLKFEIFMMTGLKDRDAV